MENRKKDRRVRKTQKALQNGLIQLMETKSISKITVKELADHADIHRGTFYFHYKDIYDLLEQTEKECLTEITNILDQYHSDIEPVVVVMTNLNIYIKENAIVFNSLFNHNTNRDFSLKIANLVQMKYLKNWIEKNFDITNGLDMLFYSDFLMMGYIGMLSRWLKEGMPLSPEKLSKKMIKLATNGISNDYSKRENRF